MIQSFLGFLFIYINFQIALVIFYFLQKNIFLFSYNLFLTSIIFHDKQSILNMKKHKNMQIFKLILKFYRI